MVLLFDNIDDMLVIIADLQKEATQVGLKLNTSNTKFMSNISGIRFHQMPADVVDQYFGPAVMVTYTAEAKDSDIYLWHGNNESTENLRVAQRTMERAMLGIRLLDRIPNEPIQRIIKVLDVVHEIDKMK